jgi:LysM repeat protein
LARKYGTSVSAIKRANGMTSDVIIKGKTIRIP